MADESGAVVKVSDSNFDSEVKNHPSLVLIDFWASWCAPCRALAPHIEDIAKRYASVLKVGKMNVDEEPNTPNTLGIRALPTLLLFKNGKVVDQLVGAVGKERIEDFFKAHL